MNCLLADIGRTIIILVFVILILPCLHQSLFVHQMLLQLQLLLLNALAIIGDGICLQNCWYLCTDRATSFDLGQP